MTQLLTGCAVGAVVLMTLMWLRQRATKNANAVDVAWSIGIAVETALLAWKADGDIVRRVVIAALVGVWATRLSTHLFLDRVLKGAEAGTYRRFRRDGSQPAFYGLYLAQAALVFLLPLTFLGGLVNTSPFPSALDVLALALWFFSIGGEALADRQLARFRENPANKGKVCREGLWKYSRHPNYFFEWLIWCAYIPLAIGSSYFLSALLGPALLLFFLLKVSGVPPTEAQALSSRGEAYRHYQRTTSVFVPWFPKEDRP